MKINSIKLTLKTLLNNIGMIVFNGLIEIRKRKKIKMTKMLKKAFLLF